LVARAAVVHSPSLSDLVGGRILKAYADRWDEYIELLIRDRWGRLFRLVIEPYDDYVCDGECSGAECNDCYEAFITYRIEPIKQRKVIK